MSKPLRILLLVCNFIALIISFFLSIIVFVEIEGRPDPEFYFVFIPLIILFFLNTYFLIGPSSLYFKRKRLEEEIKIQEAENKLKDLQSKGSNFSKEKNKVIWFKKHHVWS